MKKSTIRITGCYAKLSITRAFTMAEILIALTIIGIIAAITLPSLRANINEKTWATQRKALYSRLSQAIALLPSMNGYGEYEGTWNNNVVTVTKDTAALTFVTDGLAKVLKITNICDSNNLQKCGLPAKYMKFNGSKVDFPKNIGEFNQYFIHTSAGLASLYINPQKHINTATAAFETASGEHVAVIYNPMCATREMSFPLEGNNLSWFEPKSIIPYMCATFLFDLNGKKGPNKMGKDMWVITSLYSVEPSVVMLDPDKITKSGGDLNFDNSKHYCASQNARMANVDEDIASFLSGQGIRFGWLGTSTGNTTYAYVITSTGTLIKYLKTGIGVGIRCIKR